MIRYKLTKVILIFLALSLTQCYTEPFFELTVEIVDQDLNPVSGTNIVIEATDIDDGSSIDGSIIYFEATTNNNGTAEFSFENKAFISARACLNSNDLVLCKDGHIYLEENSKKTLTLMIENGECLYCF